MKKFDTLKEFDPLLKNLNPSKIFDSKMHCIFLQISVSVSDRYRADMKKILSVIYRIGQFEKWDLSVLIGIGRYEKKLIDRTLSLYDN